MRATRPRDPVGGGSVRPRRQWPLLLVSALVLGGVVAALLGPDTWRAGCLVVGGGLVLGALLVVPFIIFGLAHLVTSWKRPNKTAVRLGLALLVASIVLLLSGIVLVRLDVPLAAMTDRRLADLTLSVKDPTARTIGYWLHVGTPLLAIFLYIRHRLAG